MNPAIDRVLTDPVESGKIPGVAALVAGESGIVYQGAFGRRAIDKPEPMTLDSVFRIASMTKAITATAAMQLVESGRIGLDQAIGELLPFTRAVQVLEGFDDAGQPRLRAPAGPVLAQLAALRAALPDPVRGTTTSVHYDGAGVAPFFHTGRRPVASAAAGAYGLHRGLERGNHMVAAANARHAVAVDSARRQAYGQGLGDGMAEYMTRRWGPPSVSGGLRAALARSGQR